MWLGGTLRNLQNLGRVFLPKENHGDFDFASQEDPDVDYLFFVHDDTDGDWLGGRNFDLHWLFCCVTVVK